MRIQTRPRADRGGAFPPWTRGAHAAILVRRPGAARGWDQGPIDAAQRGVADIEATLAGEPDDGYLIRVLHEALPNHAAM